MKRVPEHEGNFCGTGKWLNRILAIVLLVAIALCIWRCWSLGVQIAEMADKFPEIIMSFERPQEIHTTINVVVKVTNETVNVTQACSAVTAP